jgi:hypothetical protein
VDQKWQTKVETKAVHPRGTKKMDLGINLVEQILQSMWNKAL